MVDYDAFQRRDIGVEGFRVHYVDEGSGPTLVMVHGSPLSSYSFRRQIHRLRSHYRLLCPDMLGFGRSDKPEPGGDFLLLSRVMRGWMNAVCPDRFALLGHNWGGPVSLGAAVERPEQIQKLILLNTTVRPQFQPPRYWRGFTAKGIGDALVVSANLFAHGLPVLMKSAWTLEVRREYRKALGPKGARRTVLRLERQEGFVELTTKITGRLDQMRVPTLILWGDPDPYFRKQELGQLQELFPGAVVHKLPGAGHFVQEDAAAQVADHLAAFLAPA